MPTILRKLPFFEAQTTLEIPGQPGITVKHHQIILWVSIGDRQILQLPDNAPRFPAVLDTGFNDNFLLQEQQLVSWAGMTPQALPVVDSLIVGGRHIPLRDANVWIHPNQAGFRDRFASGQPFRVELDTGIAVWPARLPGAPRLPLLGIRALRRADLRVWIDCRKCQVWMSTRRGFWFFG